MIILSNPFIVIISYSTLNMSVILFGSPFVFYTPWKYFCLQHSTVFHLIVVLLASIRLDSPFNFVISWHFCLLECSLAVIVIVIIPDNTILLYSIAVNLIVILPGIPFNCDTPSQSF